MILLCLYAFVSNICNSISILCQISRLIMNSQWDVVFNNNSTSTFDLKNLANSKDLLFLFFKRDFETTYKQTILGPLWYLIQPTLSTLIYLVVFYKIAGIQTPGIPPILFYLSSVILWNFMADGIPRISNSLRDNQYLCSKVYFPRIIIPLSILLNLLMKFAIQFGLFLFVFIFYLIKGEVLLSPLIVMLPFILLITCSYCLGIGLIISSLTAKYRDLAFMIGLIVQILLYITPVLYPLISVPTDFAKFIHLNPMSGLFEGFRSSLFLTSQPFWELFPYTIIIGMVLLIVGLILFDKTQRNYIDIA